MSRKPIQILAVFFALGLLTAWGLYAVWQLWLAQRAGMAIHEAIEADWPEDAAPPVGTRERLVATTAKMVAGDFAAVIDDMGNDISLTSDDRALAERFLRSEGDLYEEFLALTTEAQALQREGADATTVRSALARALVAAARRDRQAAALQIEIAKVALGEVVLGQVGSTTAGPEVAAGLLERIGPSYLIGRDLMTEGHAALSKLLTRVRRHYDEGDFSQAVAVLRLAANLSGVDTTSAHADSPPDWFHSLEPASPAPATKETAEAVVKLCRSMAEAAEPSEPAVAIIRSAQRELTAGRHNEAVWWATVALNVLGMSDQEIVAATGPSE